MFYENCILQHGLLGLVNDMFLSMFTNLVSIELIVNI